MNDLDHCLEVVSRSRQPLRHIRRWISRKPLDLEAWFRWTTMAYGDSMVTWPMTSRDPARSNSTPITLSVCSHNSIQGFCLQGFCLAVCWVSSRFTETRFAETCFAETRFAETRFAEIRVRGWCLPDSPKPDSPKPVSPKRDWTVCCYTSHGPYRLNELWANTKN